MMEYKGYAAGPIDFDPGDKTFSGTVAGLRDVVHFEGRTATELERAFRDSIESYLGLCVESGAGTLEAWLTDKVVPSAEVMRENPAQGRTGEEVRASLAQAYKKLQKAVY
jgi:hypothetical protein